MRSNRCSSAEGSKEYAGAGEEGEYWGNMALPVERMTSAGDVYVWLLALPAMNAPRRLMSGVSMICLRKKIDVCFINVSDALTFDQMVQPSSHRGRSVSAEVMTRFRLLTEEDAHR